MRAGLLTISLLGALAAALWGIVSAAVVLATPGRVRTCAELADTRDAPRRVVVSRYDVVEVQSPGEALNDRIRNYPVPGGVPDDLVDVARRTIFRRDERVDRESSLARGGWVRLVPRGRAAGWGTARVFVRAEQAARAAGGPLAAYVGDEPGRLAGESSEEFRSRRGVYAPAHFLDDDTPGGRFAGRIALAAAGLVGAVGSLVLLLRLPSDPDDDDSGTPVSAA